MDWLLYLLLLGIVLFALAITVMTLPGTWLMLAAAAGYAWATHGAFISWGTLAVLLGIAVVAEVMETVSAGAGARRAGSGRRGAWGALIGGIVGGIFLTIPFPLVGTLIGVCIGTFVGAMVGELSGGREIGRSAFIGVSAAGGRLKGALLKLAFGCLMLVIILWAAFPVGAKTSRAAPARTITTAPG